VAEERVAQGSVDELIPPIGEDQGSRDDDELGSQVDVVQQPDRESRAERLLNARFDRDARALLELDDPVRVLPCRLRSPTNTQRANVYRP